MSGRFACSCGGSHSNHALEGAPPPVKRTCSNCGDQGRILCECLGSGCKVCHKQGYVDCPEKRKRWHR